MAVIQEDPGLNLAGAEIFSLKNLFNEQTKKNEKNHNNSSRWPQHTNIKKTIRTKVGSPDRTILEGRDNRVGKLAIWIDAVG